MQGVFRIAARTDVGIRKKTNQDSCCALTATTDVGPAALVAVCDGVGGLSAGEVASASVARWLSDWFEGACTGLLGRHSGDLDALFSDVDRQWDAGLRSMNNAIFAFGNDSGSRLGTTCTAILLFGGRYTIAHVGDTRVYRLSGGGMSILTEDQTWVAQEVAKGNIPVEKARSHPKRNVILQSVGTQEDVVPEFYRGGYEAGDVFMVCCDGFRNELFDDEIIEGFGSLGDADEGTMGKVCEDMIALVLQRGERDNITVACLGCHEEGLEAKPDGEGAGDRRD